MYALPGVRFGGTHTEPNLLCVRTETDSSLLGLDFFSRYNVTFDFENDALVLYAPPPTASRVRFPGDSGIILEDKRKNKAGWNVQAVLGDTPAYRAGLRAGDALLRIQGETLAPDTHPQTLLDGFAGQKAILHVRKPNGKLATVAFNRLSAIIGPESKAPRYGVYLSAHHSGKVVIDEVKTTGVYTQLKIGDRLVEVNGQLLPRANSLTLVRMLVHYFQRKGETVQTVFRRGKARIAVTLKRVRDENEQPSAPAPQNTTQAIPPPPQRAPRGYYRRYSHEKGWQILPISLAGYRKIRI